MSFSVIHVIYVEIQASSREIYSIGPYKILVHFCLKYFRDGLVELLPTDFSLIYAIRFVQVHLIHQQIPLWSQKLYHLHILRQFKSIPGQQVLLSSPIPRNICFYSTDHIQCFLYYTLPCILLFPCDNIFLLCYPHTGKQYNGIQRKLKDSTGNIYFLSSPYFSIIV